MAVWSFPQNGNGQIRGYSDPGIETFSGNILKSLARETCQNSLDACADGETTVGMEFEVCNIKTANIPGYKDFKRIITKCRSYWKSQKSLKAHKFLDEAYTQIMKEETCVLRISDYNTKGLAEPFGDSFEGWNSLTKVDGGSTKDGDSAGSYGVGKNATFSNSFFRLVFYRTINEKQEKAAQGMCRFLSFPDDEMKPMDTMTVGTGYYGDAEKNKPVIQINELESLNNRTKVGTDIFIYGFKGNSNWKAEVISEILENFLMAIYKNKLAVTVQGTLINADLLEVLLKKYGNLAKNANCNHRVLTEPEKTVVKERDFHGLGTLRLSVLIDPLSKLNRKVLVVRKSGMKLFHLAGISRVISFTGILELEGIKINEYFKDMETMAHDKWDPKKHSNPTEASVYYGELKDWVRTTIMDLGENTSDEEVEVEGLSNILKESDPDSENSELDKSEGLNDHLDRIDIIEQDTPYDIKGKFYPIGNNAPYIEGNDEMPGKIEKDGSFFATRSLKGSRKRKTRDKHKGTPDDDGYDIIHKPLGISEPCNLKNVRIIKLDTHIYRMIFEIPYNVEEGHIDIVSVGENGRSSKLFVKDAVSLSNCSSVFVNSGIISFRKMQGNSKVKIQFSLCDSREYAMEVSVYEHN